MKTEINYTPDWYIECPETEEEWNVFVEIMTFFDVRLYDKTFKPSRRYVTCDASGKYTYRTQYVTPDRRKVSLLEVITLLQRPIKTEKQRKIEELEATIAEALKQVEELKGHEK